MMRAIAFILVVSLVVIARAAGGDGVTRFATMALGFVLIVAPLVGEAGERVGLPRITGYMLVGLVAGPDVLNLVTPGMAAQLRLVNGLAVALIAFGAGVELDLEELAPRWKSLLRHGGFLIGGLFLGLVVATLGALPFIELGATSPWGQRIAIALIVGATMATFSPTVVMAVLAETRAKGPLAERVLALVVAGDLAIVLLFTLSTSAARLLDGGNAEVGSAVGHVVLELVGSILVGLLAGFLVVLYRALIDRRSDLLVVGMCLALAEVGSRIGLSPLLACLAAGLVVRNAAPEAAHAMDELLRRVRLPVLVVFFAAAGASVRLGDLPALAPLAIGLALVRYLLIVGMNRAGARAAGFDPVLARYVPSGLLAQAGVTVGLAVIVGRGFGQWGSTLETLIVAVISLEQFIGPVLFRLSLAKAGEIPRADAAEVTPPPEPAADAAA